MIKKRGRPPTGRAYDGYGVYTITCTENSRIYIGGSNSVYNRVCNQKCRLRKANPACNFDLLKDFQKYGEGAFRFEIVRKCNNRQEFLMAEQSLINKYKPSGLLYNDMNAYTERAAKRKMGPRCIRLATSIPSYQMEWLERKSSVRNICRNYYLEILIDQLIALNP